jgi:CheY-like chemotaxis protein/two-component sensor histidine kinase
MLRMDSIAPEKRQRAIEVIERNAVAQNRLIEDLLDMSRITTGKVRLDPTVIPVVSLLRESLEGVRPAADAKRITLAVDFDPFAGSVMADSTRLQQVFWNLLTNAVKFTPEAGRVAVALRRRAMNVEIVISDSGRGISPAFLPFVFEPFRQGESRFESAHGGLGLGLAITRQLVELHGGTIRASSPGVDQGAAFTVTLPCVSERHAALDGTLRGSSAARQPSAPVATTSLVGLKVLVVDDEPDTLELFRDALEAAGADVRAAPAGPEALSVAATWPPDLVVTDLGLPGMDGYELLAAIRKTRPAAACPAIAVSAHARLDDRSRALAAGFQAHVAKPIEPPALVSILCSTLDARGAETLGPASD